MKTYKTTAPSSGHLIVFYKIQLGQKAQDIKLKDQDEEVDSICWVSKENIWKIFNYVHGTNDCIYTSKPLDSKVNNNSQIESALL